MHCIYTCRCQHLLVNKPYAKWRIVLTDSKPGNKQASVGKIQIKRVTTSTSHQSPPSGTCHTEFLVENKDTYLDTRAHHETRDRWEGANQFKQSDKARQSKTIRAKLHSNGTTMNALSEIFKAVNNQ